MNMPLPRIVRYILSGGTGAVVNIGTVFLLTHYLGLWYLASSICAFLFSLFVSFYLQRTWTFKQTMPHTMTRQIMLYLAVSLFNLALNTGIVYVCVEYLGLWYVFAQIFAGAIVAITSFFFYKNIIFITPKTAHV
jgi:putative flippase GtrA